MQVNPIELEVNGQNLRGNLYKAEDPKPLAFLFLHGWTGMPNEDAAKIMAQNVFTCMTFSLSGHNNSDGKIEEQTRQKSFQEVIAAYNFLKTKLLSNSRIGVVGTSYGSYLAAVLSSEVEVSCMSLRVPANYRDELFDELQIGQGADNPEVVQWRKLKLDFNETSALRAVHSFNGPIQIIEAGDDDRVSHQAVQNYVDAVLSKSKLEYHFMKDWPHSLGTDKKRNADYQKILLNWLRHQ